MMHFAEPVRRAVQSIGTTKTTATLKTHTGEGYMTEFIARKLCIAQMYVNASGQHVDWANVGVEDLRRLSADSCDSSAETISSFVGGRPDWPMVASMYMCLWKEFTDEVENKVSYTSSSPSLTSALMR